MKFSSILLVLIAATQAFGAEPHQMSGEDMAQLREELGLLRVKIERQEQEKRRLTDQVEAAEKRIDELRSTLKILEESVGRSQ